MGSMKNDHMFRIMNRTVPVLLGILLFLNPLPSTTAIKEICLYGAALLILILAGFRKVEFSFR